MIEPPQLPPARTPPDDYLNGAQAFVDAQYERMKAGVKVEAIYVPFALVYEP